MGAPPPRGSAEARWGWRVVDGDGVGTVSASDLGPAYSSLVLPFPTTLGTRLRLSGVWLWLTAILNMPTARLMATDIVGLSWGPYYPRYRYAGYPYRRVYYGYGGYPYRRSQRVVACEVETTLKRPPSGGLCCFE